LNRAPRRTGARALALAAATLSAAISACGGGDGARDAAPPIDARHLADAAVIACADDPDAGCGGERLTPVCDLERGACVECVTDGDCDRAGSFGTVCDLGPGYCRCERDQDCEGNTNGPSCHPIVHACTCLLDKDCADGQECELEPYLGSDVRTCRRSSEQ